MPLLPELLSPLMPQAPPSGHTREFLTIALPGFEWLTVKGFVIGLVKSFLYGALIGVVYVPIYNALQRRFGT